MPVFRVYFNGKDTGEYVTASNPVDAYADVSASMQLAYSDRVQLKEVASPDDQPGFPVGNRTIRQVAHSTLEQEHTIDRPE